MLKFEKYLAYSCGLLAWIDWIPYLEISSFSLLKQSIFLIFIALNVLRRISNFELNILQISLVAFFLIVVIFSTLHEVIFLSYYLNYLILALLLFSRPLNAKIVISGFLTGSLITFAVCILYWFGFSIPVPNGMEELGLSQWFYTDSLQMSRIGLTNKYNKLSYLAGVAFFISTQGKRDRISWLWSALMLILIINSGGRGGLLLIVVFLSIVRPRLLLIGLGSFFLVNIRDVRVLQLFNESSKVRIDQYNRAIETSNALIGDNGFADALDSFGFLHIHNFYLNSYFNSGIVGLVMSVILIVNIFRYFSFRDRVYRGFLLAIVLTQSLFENFNLVIVLSAYLPVWIMLIEKRYDERFVV